jgi:hypothetical protein
MRTASVLTWKPNIRTFICGKVRDIRPIEMSIKNRTRRRRPDSPNARSVTALHRLSIASGPGGSNAEPKGKASRLLAKMAMRSAGPLVEKNTTAQA